MKAVARRLAPLLFAAAASCAWAQKTELLVYTALETDQLKAYTESFQKTNPNIDLKFVRDSTGVVTAKLLAEKANPQADAILGVAASSMEKTLREAGKSGANVDAAKAVGKLVAQRAVEKGVTSVVFDRGRYLYHGRVKALGDAAREAGLKF